MSPGTVYFRCGARGTNGMKTLEDEIFLIEESPTQEEAFRRFDNLMLEYGYDSNVDTLLTDHPSNKVIPRPFDFTGRTSLRSSAPAGGCLPLSGPSSPRSWRHRQFGQHPSGADSYALRLP